MIITILLATAVATTAPKEQTPPPKQERIIVGGYTEDGKKVDTYDEQVADAMQKRIDDLNKKYKDIDKEDTEHQDHSQKPKKDTKGE